MTVLAVSVPCQQGGTTILNLSFESQQAGSSSDRAQFRVVRNDGNTDVILPTQPQFYMGANRDIRSWSFIDVNVPFTGNFNYRVQILRIAGGGTFGAMNLIANHYRR